MLVHISFSFDLSTVDVGIILVASLIIVLLSMSTVVNVSQVSRRTCHRVASALSAGGSICVAHFLLTLSLQATGVDIRFDPEWTAIGCVAAFVPPLAAIALFDRMPRNCSIAVYAASLSASSSLCHWSCVRSLQLTPNPHPHVWMSSSVSRVEFTEVTTLLACVIFVIAVVVLLKLFRSSSLQDDAFRLQYLCLDMQRQMVLLSTDRVQSERNSCLFTLPVTPSLSARLPWIRIEADTASIASLLRRNGDCSTFWKLISLSLDWSPLTTATSDDTDHQMLVHVHHSVRQLIRHLHLSTDQLGSLYMKPVDHSLLCVKVLDPHEQPDDFTRSGHCCWLPLQSSARAIHHLHLSLNEDDLVAHDKFDLAQVVSTFATYFRQLHPLPLQVSRNRTFSLSSMFRSHESASTLLLRYPSPIPALPSFSEPGIFDRVSLMLCILRVTPQTLGVMVARNEWTSSTLISEPLSIDVQQFVGSCLQQGFSLDSIHLAVYDWILRIREVLSNDVTLTDTGDDCPVPELCANWWRSLQFASQRLSERCGSNEFARWSNFELRQRIVIDRCLMLPIKLTIMRPSPTYHPFDSSLVQIVPCGFYHSMLSRTSGGGDWFRQLIRADSRQLSRFDLSATPKLNGSRSSPFLSPSLPRTTQRRISNLVTVVSPSSNARPPSPVSPLMLPHSSVNMLSPSFPLLNDS